MCQKLRSDDVHFLRYGAQRTNGQTDRQMDGTDGWMHQRTEKVTYTDGCPI